MSLGLEYPVDALVSYHYYKTDNAMKQVTGPRHLRLIADSGAFSAYTQGAPIKLPEYAEWLLRWRSHIAWCAALDVIGDPQATFANWQFLRNNYQLETIPTLHAGGDPKWLDVYAAEGVDYLGLGGLVGVATRALPWMVHVMKYAKDKHPEMRFHAWGVTNRKVLEVLPLYSTDSSGIMGVAYRYGRLRLFDPVTAKDNLIALDGRTPYRHVDLLRRYGVTPDQVAKSNAANRRLLIQLQASSVQQFSRWLRRRHKVTPPTWGLSGPTGGTRVHVVDANPDRLAAIAPGEPGEGPRVHVVDTAYQNLADIAGPRLHMSEQYGDLVTLAPAGLSPQNDREARATIGTEPSPAER